MFNKITRKKLEYFLAIHRTDKRVLDIGAGGSGYNKFFPNRLTVDIDPARNPEIVGDIESLPFKDGEFEFILCTEVLEHVNDPFKAVGELSRVLKSGGTLLLTTRFMYPIHDAPHDLYRFTKYGLRHLFNDWDIDELEEETTGFSTLAVLLQRFAFQMHFRCDKPMKFLLFLLAWLLTKLDWLIIKEYGNIQKTKIESNLFASGYYLVAHKK
ncbi:MAG: hypothetical protein A2845_03360 [Candidatus Lloydbacteria bacterium RIFCSPHIGHO2_01_FULL_49_22]|uniref:Methyltransferase type 11 domain-containing protein n=1 Tax=Candidatus Lloydbacteria bacterium RIFCSPHIGHO2_01_FULL_49_22 TaxID=1798658 RepID=A0A1G2CWR9_9BACT|nr:MAG: hypothetical protein A2845_03360 [Candidatus Lloydbacteria bacterium RIFCSPHIGHO2_01_FULL_49_22]OGZ08969.1 MAG: hypothetical protein A3C14_03195 [Candidatus Lloydbacteria bacterium RIFCSPHIGHO2_02_FULL_50_18]